MSKKVFVLYSPGTNCEMETTYAFERAGGDPELLPINDLLSGARTITNCDALCVAGGFAYGDCIRSGVITAAQVSPYLHEARLARIPILGICNGFQVLAESGVFGDVTLTRNDCGTFCSRMTNHTVVESPCIWLRGMAGSVLRFPSAHGEGKVVYHGGVQATLTYTDASPNGGAIAGLTTEDGLVLGLMDHPERLLSDANLQIFRNGLGLS